MRTYTYNKIKNIYVGAKIFFKKSKPYLQLTNTAFTKYIFSVVLKLQYCIFTVGGILAPSSGAWKETSFCLMDVVDAVKTDGLLPFFY